MDFGFARRPVALMARAPDSKSGRWGFESLQACQSDKHIPGRERLIEGGIHIFKRLKKFVVEVEVEMRKVSWMTRKELIASTSVVVVATLLIALFIFVVDTPLSRLIGLILKYGT